MAHFSHAACSGYLLQRSHVLTSIPVVTSIPSVEVPRMRMTDCICGASGNQVWTPTVGAGLLGSSSLLAGMLRSRRRVRGRVRYPTASQGLRFLTERWRAVRRKASRRKEFDEEDDFNQIDDLFDKARVPAVGTINSFAAGASLQSAKVFAMTRTFAVAAWDEDVTPKPIFAVSDSTGEVAKALADTAFKQFGTLDKAMVQVVTGVRTEADVRRVVEQAADLAPDDALAIERAGALILFSIADEGLGNALVKECAQSGVPCINAMESCVVAMEKSFGVKRSKVWDSASSVSTAPLGKVVYVASDSSGHLAHGMACKALKQFPSCGVDSVVVCPQVNSLEEIDHIVQQAKTGKHPLIYTFASPGMSRFMRQQCERAKVSYAEVLQPIVIAFERYLDYPPVGVPGGYATQSTPLSEHENKWERRQLQR